MKETERHDDLLAETPEAQQDERPGNQFNQQQDDRLPRIQRRAYELWEARGGGPGGEWDDWLMAEGEIDAALGTPIRDEQESYEQPSYSHQATAD